ncbi:efflux RND transporter periplasmic adaptor subunit [Ekhidna sp.]|jgi:RND family efflux transporter MFP subunit|uniref:efflux RND transporter periplasmic adaptor subunit n=1 Tax=Ekhidna sp. TaxID=2608089 RepID=UPI0032F04771
MSNIKSKVSKTIITAVVLIVITGWTVNTLLANAEEVKERVYTRDFSIKVPVKAEQVTTSELVASKRYLGTFEANREIFLRSQTQGEVKVIRAEEGDRLKRGQLIASVDAENIEFQLIAAKAAYEDAKREVARYENLTDKNAVAKINLEKAILQLANAESNLKLLNKQLSNTRIRAPFDGTLASRTFDLGSVLGQGEPLGLFIDISKLKLAIEVPEEDISDFTLGKSITVHSDIYPEHQYPGVVSMVGDKADDAHKFEVEIKIENSSKAPLKSGMYGWIENINEQSGKAITIPATAMLGATKDAKVFKIVDGKAVTQPILIGKRVGDRLEVKDGLAIGDLIVTNGQVNLTEGTAVSY